MINNEFALENIVSDEEADAIENLTTHPQFPWNYCAGTILPKDVDENPYVIPTGGNPFQFTHTVNLENCPYIDTIRPVLNAIATHFGSNLQIIKVKFNLLTQSSSSDYHLPHTDIDEGENCYSSIYYVNESDGDTYLFNEFGPKESNDISIRSQVSPQKGKLVVFDARRFHASSSPIDNDVRIIMNVVFKVNNND
jgi:hypothetical protein